MKPEVSIIIPARNAERYIAASVKSAIACPTAEVLVVDHASTDATVAIARRALYAGAQMSFAQVGGGPSRPKNVGLRDATCDYVTFLDADDVMVPNSLWKRVSRMRETGALVSCGRIAGLIDRHGNPMTDASFDSWVAVCDRRNRDLERKDTPTSPPMIDAAAVANSELPGYFTMVYHRSIFEKVGLFDENLLQAEDFDMAYRCARAAGGILFVDTPCVWYRIHDTNTSLTHGPGGVQTRPEMREYYQAARKKHGLP